MSSKTQAQSASKTTVVNTVSDDRIKAALKALESSFENGEPLNTCNAIKLLTRLNFKPTEIIAATGFNKVTVYRQSREAIIAKNFGE